jgi:GAF domain-containing protein
MASPVPAGPAGPDTQASWLLELQELLLASDGLNDFLHDVAVLAAQATETSCGVTLHPDGRPATVASSDDLAGRVDEIQYSTDAGPCLHSLRTGQPVEVADLAHDRRWPQFSAHGFAHGVRCSLSLPLAGHFGIVGVLNLYARRPRAYDATVRQRAEVFAATAAGAVAIARRLAEKTQLTEDLQTALSNRSVIDQAIGILMTRGGLSARAAFEVLRKTSHTRNIKIKEVAVRLIRSVTGSPPDTGVGFQPRP